MLETFDVERRASMGRDEISVGLERGSIVYFPETPVALPPDEDLDFIRDELPRRLKLKNISYHPEADRVKGLESEDPSLTERVKGILTGVSARIAAFLEQAAPRLTENWTVGTSGFRPLQEQGRNLSPHASNELVHIDAGAYGATHGDRILRFFINVNPSEDRVWATKGNFDELLQAHGERAGLGFVGGKPDYLKQGPLDHLWSGIVRGASLGVPILRVLDSSPFDREMRRFHNYMKDTTELQQQREGHAEFRFPPFSAWMVFTDTVSHACLSGQYAFIHTGIVPLESCRLPEVAPINLLRQAAGAARV